MNKTLDELTNELQAARERIAELESKHQALKELHATVRRLLTADPATEPLAHDRYGPLFKDDLDADDLRDGRLSRSPASVARMRTQPARRTDGRPLTEHQRTELDQQQLTDNNQSTTGVAEAGVSDDLTSNTPQVADLTPPPSDAARPGHPLNRGHRVDHPSHEADRNMRENSNRQPIHQTPPAGTPPYNQETHLYDPNNQGQGTPAGKNQVSGSKPPMDVNNIVGGPNEPALRAERRVHQDKFEQQVANILNQGFKPDPTAAGNIPDSVNTPRARLTPDASGQLATPSNQASPSADPDAPVHPKTVSDYARERYEANEKRHNRPGSSDETTNHPDKPDRPTEDR
jgi:hypothetical protein